MDLTELTTRLEAALQPLGLTLRGWNDGVYNIITKDEARELTREDVDAFRAALTEAGYVEVESWIAWQNRSWMSDGTFAGVSFRVRPVS